jgi:hypothetical protein
MLALASTPKGPGHEGTRYQRRRSAGAYTPTRECEAMRVPARRAPCAGFLRVWVDGREKAADRTAALG